MGKKSTPLAMLQVVDVGSVVAWVEAVLEGGLNNFMPHSNGLEVIKVMGQHGPKGAYSHGVPHGV